MLAQQTHGPRLSPVPRGSQFCPHLPLPPRSPSLWGSGRLRDEGERENWRLRNEEKNKKWRTRGARQEWRLSEERDEWNG